MTNKQVDRKIDVFKADNNFTVIKITKPSGGFNYGKEVDFITLTAEETLKLKEQL